jgi:DNA repair exonuclease SbcCD nuclease subunit
MTFSSDATDGAVIGLVVTGDNHLSPALPRLSPGRRLRRRDWLRSGFKAAVDCALERHAALFINTGDLFDSPAPSNQDRAFVAEQLHRLGGAGIVCIAISGNHDTPRMQTEHGGESPQQVYSALDELHYFATSDLLEPEVFTLGAAGGEVRVAVIGLSNNPVAPPGSDPLAMAQWGAGATDALAHADVALLIVHAALEGLARPNEGERTITQASLAALPAQVRLVVAGHIHRYARQRMGQREVVVVGATERMEFGAQSGEPGFVWAELARDGVRHIEHIRTKAQPRAEITLHTSRLWPATSDDLAPGEPAQAEGAQAEGAQAEGAQDEAAHALDVIRAELEAVCTPDTMARLRLTGPLTREQYHQLALREVITVGQQRAFSLDVDTSGLTLTERAFALPDLGPQTEAISPARMVALVVEETLRQSQEGAAGMPDPDDVRAAGELLLARLRASGEEGA